MTQPQTMEKSRYLDYFRANQESLKERGFQVIGDVILVEKLKLPEPRTASGIILTTHKNQLGTIAADSPVFCRVLVPGEGYYNDETKESVPLNVEAGDIILVSAVGVKYFSSFPLLETYEPDSLALTTESNIQIRFKGENAFRDILGDINQGTKKPMEVPAGSAT